MSSGLLLLNGRIYTMDPSLPFAEAVAVEGSRIVFVGDSEQGRAVAEGKGWEIMDLRGKAVVPGFIDSHIHFLGYALGLEEINLDGVPSLEEALRIVAERAKEVKPGEWITGRGWNHNLWGGRLPTKEDLDRAAPQNPVALLRKDGHLIWVNSQAMVMAGIDRHTPDPPGGEILRDERGEPTGIFKENAVRLFQDGIANLMGRVIPEPSAAVRQRALRRAMEIAQSRGLTGIHDFEGATAFSDFQALDAKGELGLRVYMGIPVEKLEDALHLGIKSGFGNAHLRLGHLKIFADGTLGSQTADMLEPFEEQPHNRGIEDTSQEELERLVQQASQNGIACAIHAIGDRAVRRALDAIEKVASISKELRHRIEHAQLVNPQELPRFARLGVIASMQPIHATSDMLIADEYWGQRARYSYAWRSLLKSGARLAFGSDSPVEDLDPLVGIHAAVTRQRADGTPPGGWYPEESLTVEEAVYAYTIGAAYASGEEAIKGSIAPGKLADMVIPSQDIFRISPTEILETHVVVTVFDGRVVYRAGEEL